MAGGAPRLEACIDQLLECQGWHSALLLLQFVLVELPRGDHDAKHDKIRAH